MARRNFISKDFFVHASEVQAKESLLSIPGFMPGIKLLWENKLVSSLRFLYQPPEDKPTHHLNISVLPLNDEYTRITLHVSYSNGQCFSSDPNIIGALQFMESAINRVLERDRSHDYATPGLSFYHRLTQWVSSSAESLHLLPLRKKLS